MAAGDLRLVPQLVAAVRTALCAQANAKEAVGMAAYMRNQFPFYGVKAPIRRAAVRIVLDSFVQQHESLRMEHPVGVEEYLGCTVSGIINRICVSYLHMLIFPPSL